MKTRFDVARLANKIGFVAKRTQLAAATAILAGGLMFSGSASAEVIYFEDFESLTLNPFDQASGGDGTDWTDVGPSGWTRDNSLMGSESTEGAYNGMTFMDIDSWIGEQGAQGWRDQFTKGGVGQNGTVLVGDPDAWDDFASGGTFNSFWTTNDISVAGFSDISVSFDSHYYTYGNMKATVDVSYDGGSTFENLLTYDSAIIGNYVAYFDETLSYNLTPTSDTVTLRFGLTNAGNDWAWAVDNVSVSGTAAAVPEASTLGLLGLLTAGVAGQGLRRRLAKKKSQTGEAQA